MTMIKKTMIVNDDHNNNDSGNEVEENNNDSDNEVEENDLMTMK